MSMMTGAAVPPLNLFRTLLRHELGDRIRPLGSGLLTRGALPATEREAVIHRVCARLGCEYEWGVHVVLFARPLGLSEEWIAATATGDATDPAFTPRQAALIQLVDELEDTGRVSDDLWAELMVYFDDRQLLEALMLAGWYHVIAYVANGAEIDREEWAARFPARVEAAPAA